MDFVKIDLNEIERTIAVYGECKVELEEMSDRLKGLLDDLNSKWQGDACVRFYEESGQAFYSSMNMHLEMIEALQKELALLSEAFQLLDRELVNRFE